MKEKQVRLTAEEIDYLLKGSIHWDDIERRVEVPLRKSMEPRVEAPVRKPLEPFAEDSLQALKLDDLKVEGSGLEEGLRPRPPRFEDDLKRRGPRLEEDLRLREFRFEEDFKLKDDPRLIDSEAKSEDALLPQEGDFAKPLLEGKAVYWVLSGVSFLTLGTWIYFVFAG